MEEQNYHDLNTGLTGQSAVYEAPAAIDTSLAQLPGIVSGNEDLDPNQDLSPIPIVTTENSSAAVRFGLSYERKPPMLELLESTSLDLFLANQRDYSESKRRWDSDQLRFLDQQKKRIYQNTSLNRILFLDHKQRHLSELDEATQRDPPQQDGTAETVEPFSVDMSSSAVLAASQEIAPATRREKREPMSFSEKRMFRSQLLKMPKFVDSQKQYRENIQDAVRTVKYRKSMKVFEQNLKILGKLKSIARRKPFSRENESNLQQYRKHCHRLMESQLQKKTAEVLSFKASSSNVLARSQDFGNIKVENIDDYTTQQLPSTAGFSQIQSAPQSPHISGLVKSEEVKQEGEDITANTEEVVANKPDDEVNIAGPEGTEEPTSPVDISGGLMRINEPSGDYALSQQFENTASQMQSSMPESQMEILTQKLKFLQNKKAQWEIERQQPKRLLNFQPNPLTSCRKKERMKREKEIRGQNQKLFNRLFNCPPTFTYNYWMDSHEEQRKYMKLILEEPGSLRKSTPSKMVLEARPSRQHHLSNIRRTERRTELMHLEFNSDLKNRERQKSQAALKRMQSQNYFELVRYGTQDLQEDSRKREVPARPDVEEQNTDLIVGPVDDSKKQDPPSKNQSSRSIKHLRPSKPASLLRRLGNDPAVYSGQNYLVDRQEFQNLKHSIKQTQKKIEEAIQIKKAPRNFSWDSQSFHQNSEARRQKQRRVSLAAGQKKKFLLQPKLEIFDNIVSRVLSDSSLGGRGQSSGRVV